MRNMRALLLVLVAALAFDVQTSRATDYDHVDTANPLPATTPDSNSYGRTRTFLQREDAARFKEMFTSFVVEGGIHGNAAGRTASPSPLIAYPGGIRITESGVTAITYQDETTCWVIAHRDLTANVAGFTRVAGSHFAVQCGTTTQPALPDNSVWLMKVVTSGGSITAVTDLRTLSPVGSTGTTTAGTACVRPVGADPTGVTDSYNALQGAISTCATELVGAEGPNTANTGCTVCPDAGRYLVRQTLVIPSLVSFEGVGAMTLTTDVDNLDEIVQVDETDPRGNRYGAIQNVWIDCNFKARIGWNIGLSVERYYANIGASECKYAGMVLHGAQNNEIIGLNLEKNGLLSAGQTCAAFNGSTFECAAGLRLENGAGNNLISRCEVNENTPYQAVLWDNGLDAFGFAAGPTGNTFDKCVFERPQTGALAQIYIRSGRYNICRECDISSKGLSGPFTAVRMTQEDRAAMQPNPSVPSVPPSTLSNAHNRFVGGANLGTIGQTTAFKIEATNGYGIRIRARDMLIENHVCGFNADSTSAARVNVADDVDFGGVTQRYCGAAALDTAVSAMDASYKLRVTREHVTQLALQSDVGGQICTSDADCSSCAANADCGARGTCIIGHCNNTPVCFPNVLPPGATGTCVDSFPRYTVTPDGIQRWGSGAFATDIQQTPAVSNGDTGLDLNGLYSATQFQSSCGTEYVAPIGKMRLYCGTGGIPKISVNGAAGMPFAAQTNIAALPGATVGCIPAFASTAGNSVNQSGLCVDGSGNATFGGVLSVDRVNTSSHAATNDNNFEIVANVGSPSCAVKGEDGKYKILFNGDGTGLVCFGTSEVAHLVQFGPNTTMPTCDAAHVGLPAYDGDGTKGPCVCTESNTWRPIVTNTTNADCG